MAAEWELSKENVQPVKRGRSAALLSDVLLSKRANSNLGSLEEDRSKYFEEQLSLAKDPSSGVSSALDSLLVYENQFKWIRDNFPTDASRLLKLLERCTFELKAEKELSNDTRFIKMWIEYVSQPIIQPYL